jgi:hypothetical protein
MRSHLRLVHATDLPLEPPRRRDRRRAPRLHLVAPLVPPGTGCGSRDAGVDALADELRAGAVDASAWFDPLLDIEGRFDR